MTNINKPEICHDYDGYKKQPASNSGYYYKCGQVIWKSEEEMIKNFHCYDQAHSKSRCITESNREKLEKYFEDYFKNFTPPLCKSLEEDVVDCMKTEKNIYKCNRAIEDFKECLDSSVQRISEDFCERERDKMLHK